ncbi:MAG: NAD(P)-dependent oxidoreductase [Alphaproteobacteria bacterium]
MSDTTPDVAPGRLSADAYRENFSDVQPPLDHGRALVEANRCYFCYDAPCIEACPTGIDIPSFIHKIATGNLRGAAIDILSENIMGGSCARVCPTEVLCQRACVREAQEGKPVQIGRLQRYATDHLMARGVQPFERAEASGKRVAVVGAGPAGLACAHRLALLGHAVELFDSRPKAGGLNEFGIAAYKLPDRFAGREADFILSIGGITFSRGKTLGRDMTLADLRHDFDAVFLGLGLGGVRTLGFEGEDLGGVHNAVDYIAELRQSDDLSRLPVGRRIVVIGGGNTAIDIAVQTKRLGAEDVTIVYRRGPSAMSATGHEQEFAQVNGVRIRHWARPAGLTTRNGHVCAVEFEYTQMDESGRLAGIGETYSLPADMVFKAIGQTFVADPVGKGDHSLLDLDGGRIAVDDDRRTSLPDVWAGGDSVATGDDLTVSAVQDGKLAAHAIDRYLRS